ncbi:MAG: 4-hydroxy-tetrahydrodipicolinate synthase [Clostridiales bacterium]|nr:4-hydroxy-tetrahydrodipicolinate synthase [Clostridiales bacterium]
MQIRGVWLPVITPFINDEVDYVSYKRLIDYYIDKKIDGIIPLGTTGESPVIEEYEFEEILEKTMEYVGGRIPVIAGAGGNYTKKMIKRLKIIEKYGVCGILSVSPYYNRPDQRGIFEHFRCIAEATDLDIIVYNIPYRTGRNIENETIQKLAEIKNITGLKDSSGDIKQTMALLQDPPPGFSIMTGEDILFYTTLLLGGSGGIMASAHLQTEAFVDIYNKIQNNDHQGALAIWKPLSKTIPLLFEEPNPAPLKYCLHEMSLIDSPETRLPLMSITEKLENKLTAALGLPVTGIHAAGCLQVG